MSQTGSSQTSGSQGGAAQVYVSIGSNIDREKNSRAAIFELEKRFGRLTLSSIYEAESVGYEGENYYNFVAGFKTDLSVGELSKTLKQIEADYGRKPNTPIKAGRIIDIDILTYDDLVGTIDGVELPRGEITKNAYVLLPLSEVAGFEVHPLTNKNYQQLWQEYDSDKQKLWVVDLG